MELRQRLKAVTNQRIENNHFTLSLRLEMQSRLLLEPLSCRIPLFLDFQIATEDCAMEGSEQVPTLQMPLLPPRAKKSGN